MPPKKRAVVGAAESGAAFEKLKGLQNRAPGAFTSTQLNATGSGRLNGRFAMATWGSMTLLLFDWEVTMEQEFADGTGHGDYWDNPVPLKMSWSGTARMYMTTTIPPADVGQPTYNSWAVSNLGSYNGFRASADPSAATFRGYNGPVDSGQEIFIGSAYVSRSSYSAPREGMVVQEVQLRGVGAPSAGVLA